MAISEYAKSLFSNNMEDISLNLNGETKTPIVVNHKGTNTIVFSLFAVDDKVSIHTSDIVNNYAEPYEPHINNDGVLYSTIEEISIQSRNETDEYTDWSHSIPTIFGGYDKNRIVDEYDFLNHTFLTWRPQIDYVVPGIKQQLSYVHCVEDVNSDDNGPYLCVKIYFRISSPISTQLYDLSDPMKRIQIDCSYNRIKELAKTLCDDEVVAYDVYGTNKAGEVVIKPQRFVVRQNSSSYTHFFFQNSLGGFDTITATGEVTSIADGDIITAKNRDIEREVSNSLVKSWEVNTGYITTKQEENLWHEFLRSTNRYILFDDGLYRQIIIEEYKAERVKMEIDSFTFKFHYAEAEKGGYAEKMDELPDFFIE